METNSLAGALKDISIIKKSIGENKSPNGKIYIFLLLLGFVNLTYFVLSTIGATMFVMLNNYFVFTHTLKVILYILLFIYFVKIYNEEKTSSNKYYLWFLSIFTGIIFLLPLLMLFMRFFTNFILDDYRNLGESFLHLNNISMLSNVLLFCLILALCGFILKKQSMFIFSSMIFLIYLIIAVPYSEVTFDIPFSKTPNVFISLIGIYYNLVISLGYIVIATFMIINRDNAHGTK